MASLALWTAWTPSRLCLSLAAPAGDASASAAVTAMSSTTADESLGRGQPSFDVPIRPPSIVRCRPRCGYVAGNLSLTRRVSNRVTTSAKRDLAERAQAVLKRALDPRVERVQAVQRECFHRAEAPSRRRRQAVVGKHAMQERKPT